MTDVLQGEANRHRNMGEMPCDYRGRHWNAKECQGFLVALRKHVALIPLDFRMIASRTVREYNFYCFMTPLPVCGGFYGSSRKLIHHSDTKGGHDEPDYLMLECPEEKAVISMGSWWYLERSFMGGFWVFKFSRI